MNKEANKEVEWFKNCFKKVESKESFLIKDFTGEILNNGGA